MLAAVLALAMLTALCAAPASATVVWAVGDGADSSANDDQVATMIAADNPSAFLYLGDVYDSGTAAEYTSYYEPGFGQLKPRTYPTPGNHEWPNRATGYFPYWLSTIGNQAYYSFDIGAWHAISLNSETEYEAGGAQVQWLRSDLAAHPGTCNVAFMHRPRFSAGTHGDQAQLDPLWQELRGRAAIVLAGHDHDYQRLALTGETTEFVVGSGGHGLYAVSPGYAGLQAYDASNYGALRLDLSAGGANYAFRTLSGATADSGSLQCQRPSGGSSGESGPAAGSSTPAAGSSTPTAGNNPAKLEFRTRVLSQRLRRALKRGVSVRVWCDMPCRIELGLYLDRKNKGAKKRPRHRLAVKQLALEKAGAEVMRVPIPKQKRSLLAGKRRIRLIISARATDNAGNVSAGTTEALLR